jgi:class 3 adenylate cyclase
VDALYSKNVGQPDESFRFPGYEEDWVEIGGTTVGLAVSAPGWRWSTDMQPIVGGEWCQAHHVGYVISGRWGALLRDGTTVEFGTGDVYDCPPGHDGYTISEEPCVMIEWLGLRTFTRMHTQFGDRVLATLLLTDLVESTATAKRAGDTVWGDVLSRHYQTARAQLERHHGREIETTGDGLLAMFDGPAAAIRCAASIREAAARDDLRIRAGVHVGEVDVVGAGVRGVAVHEAARIMAAAAPNEILVSEITHTLATGAGLTFEDRGLHDLKGLPGERRLFAYIEAEPPLAAET